MMTLHTLFVRYNDLRVNKLLSNMTDAILTWTKANSTPNSYQEQREQLPQIHTTRRSFRHGASSDIRIRSVLFHPNTASAQQGSMRSPVGGKALLTLKQRGVGG